MKFLSFFSGAGGLDYGLELAGWDCLLALDNDKYCTETLKLNIDKFSNKHIDILHKDIREFEPIKYLREKRIRKSDISAIVGGPPCQAFSSAGKRLGLNDERGNVSIKFLDIVIHHFWFGIILMIIGLVIPKQKVYPKIKHKK